ncbi:hypothetical protein TNCV_2437521 [Trichonephila clavipes]|nr:hypothetical protein TNCV_2437521 [Trichonephila clavipes]
MPTCVVFPVARLPYGTVKFHRRSSLSSMNLKNKILQLKMSVLLGGRPPDMSGMKETVLVLLCLGQAVGEIKTTVARFLSGHTRAQRYVAGPKVYPPYPNCNVTQATPAHVLACIGWLP